ncbi:MAG: PIN domain nuclease [Clostridia bacterium]|nr:PIN domain nuclease [Clostridia bacterium]
MWQKIAKGLSFPLGILFGIGVVQAFEGIVIKHPEWGITLTPLITGVIYGASAVVFGALFFLLSTRFLAWISKTVSGVEKGLSKMPIKELLLCIGGALVGLLIAFLVSLPLLLFFDNAFINLSISLALYVLLGMTGARVARSKYGDINASDKVKVSKYVLDSSVIIDGRVVDIIELGFLGGEIVVSSLVLSEIRRIADSEDVLKRARGRRGLDMLARLQEMKVALTVDESTTDEDVDSALVKLAYKLDARLITNDFNLSRIGKMQGVTVLSINELSNAVKPILLPGEEMCLQIVKEGKELGQGVAYLEDGTMIVVEGGRRYIGQQTDCIVTSVLQTSAGRMIFAKVKEY